jgi:ADP-ribosylglycohydrolase
MALQLAESLAVQKCFNRQDILKRFLDWWQKEGFDTGPVAADVFRLILTGIPAEEASAKVHQTSGARTAGCNPAHRISPLAMAAFLADEELAHFAMQEAALTHWDPLAGDVAAAVVILCRSLIRGHSWGDACQRAVEGRTHLSKAAFQAKADVPLKKDRFAPDVLRAAIHFIQTNTSFDAVLTAAIEFVGPANYCPVLVGAIGGAQWGAAAIDRQSLAHCDILPRVYSSAQTLAGMW